MMSLVEDIAALRNDIDRLAHPNSALPPLRPASPTPSPSLKRTKSRLSRLRAPFRRLSSAGLKKVTKASDQGSSTESLVPSTPDVWKREESKDTASELLSLLAPLVSRLQGLGNKLRDQGVGIAGNTVESFVECCNVLERKIDAFDFGSGDPSSRPTVQLDAHDVEMKRLLLDALIKKVVQERTSVTSFAHANPSSDPTDSAVVTPALSRTNSTSAGSTGHPFVLHSTDVLAPRRASTPEGRPVPIAGGGQAQTHLTPYPSFADAGQHTGLANVFRLGSFQNSLLFSPSPIAVRQPLAANGMRV